MKRTIIAIAIYLSGCVCAYSLIKKDFMLANPHWENGDRVIAIGLSFGSWASALAGGIILTVQSSADWLAKPAKW